MTNTVKGLEEKPFEEYLRSLGMFSLEETEVRDPHCGLGAPHAGSGVADTHLCSGHQGQGSREWWKLYQGKFRLGMRKTFFSRGWLGTEEVPQGSDHSTEPDRAHGVFGQGSQAHDGLLGAVLSV